MSAPRPAASELQQALWRLRPAGVRAAGFSVACSLLALAPTWYMLAVYDRVVSSRSLGTLAMLTLLVLLAYGLMAVLEWVRGQIMLSAALALDRQLSPRVFQALVDAQLRRLAPASSQGLQDLQTLRDFVYAPALLAALEAPVSLVFLALIFWVHPWLGTLSLASAAVQVGIAWLNEQRTQDLLVQANRQAQAAQHYADGVLRHAEVVQAMGMVDDIQARWSTRQQAFLHAQAQASERGGSLQALARLVQNLTGSLLLGVSCWLLLHDQLQGSAGLLIVAGILGGRVLAPLVQILGQWRQVVQVREAWQRLDRLLSTVPARPQTMPLPAPHGALQLDGVSAGAPAGPAQLLRGISLALNPGESLAVVGASGAGKSTLARLLVGLWPTSQGKVRLDGVDVHTWNKAELGPWIGYLPQSVDLFEGSLAENIARFGPPDAAAVQAAARLVGLHEHITALPQGYDSPVGPEGVLLSGGQRQRVGLARALYGNPRLVVLDEPNASLDEQGDAALALALQTLKARGATVVVITLRTSVLHLLDKMLVLRDGQAQAFGPRQELLQAIQQAQTAKGNLPPASASAPALASASGAGA